MHQRGVIQCDGMQSPLQHQAAEDSHRVAEERLGACSRHKPCQCCAYEEEICYEHLHIRSAQPWGCSGLDILSSSRKMAGADLIQQLLHSAAT